jgi:hypothetical protein
MSEDSSESYARRVRHLAEEKCQDVDEEESQERIGRSMATVAACLEVLDDEENEVNEG